MNFGGWGAVGFVAVHTRATIAHERRRGCMTALPIGSQSQSVDAFLEQRCESSRALVIACAVLAAYEPSKELTLAAC